MSPRRCPLAACSKQAEAEAATRGSSVQHAEAAHTMKFTFVICRLDTTRHQSSRVPPTSGYATPRRRRKINYPSPSLRLAGRRADTSGPSSLLNCAFQSDPLNNMNRPATRRGRISVATAQMP